MDCVGIRSIQISSSITDTPSSQSLFDKQFHHHQHDTLSNTPGMVAFFHSPNDEFNIPVPLPSSTGEEENPVSIQILVTDGLKSFHGSMNVKDVKGRWSNQTTTNTAATTTTNSQSQGAYNNNMSQYESQQQLFSSQLSYHATTTMTGRYQEKRELICQFLLEEENQPLISYQLKNSAADSVDTLSIARAARSTTTSTIKNTTTDDVTNTQTIQMTLKNKGTTASSANLVRIVWTGILSLHADISTWYPTPDVIPTTRHSDTTIDSFSPNANTSAAAAGTTNSSNAAAITAMPFLQALSQSYTQSQSTINTTKQITLQLQTEVAEWKDTALKLSEGTWQEEKDGLLNRFCILMNSVKKEMKDIQEDYEECKVQLEVERSKRENYEKQQMERQNQLGMSPTSAWKQGGAFKAEQLKEEEKPCALEPEMDLDYIENLPRRKRTKVTTTASIAASGKAKKKGLVVDRKPVSLFGNRRTSPTPAVSTATTDVINTITAVTTPPNSPPNSSMKNTTTAAAMTAKTSITDMKNSPKKKNASPAKEKSRTKLIWPTNDDDTTENDDNDDAASPVKSTNTPAVAAATPPKAATYSAVDKSKEEDKYSPKLPHFSSSDEDEDYKSRNRRLRNRRRRNVGSPNTPKSKSLFKDDSKYDDPLPPPTTMTKSLSPHEKQGQEIDNTVNNKKSTSPSSSTASHHEHTGKEIVITGKMSDTTASTPNASPLRGSETKYTNTTTNKQKSPLTSIMKSPGSHSTSSRTSRSSLSSNTTKASAKSLTFDSSTLFEKPKKVLTPIREQLDTSFSSSSPTRRKRRRSREKRKRDHNDGGVALSPPFTPVTKGEMTSTRTLPETTSSKKSSSQFRRMDDDTITLHATPARSTNTNRQVPFSSSTMATAKQSEPSQDVKMGSKSAAAVGNNPHDKDIEQKKPMDSIRIHSDTLLGGASDKEETDDDSSTASSQDLL